MLDAAVRVPREAFEVAVDLTVARGEVVCLLGPNGAGKSTVLSALAGLVREARGTVVLDGTVLDGTVLDGTSPDEASPDGTTGGWATHVPARVRPVGTVFQDYRLFPHLSALENVAFGLRSRGVPRQEARRRALTELTRVGLGELGGRRPHELSGGQAQRVAVARALAPDPRLLLLDEPLSALDAESRTRLRAALGDVLRGFTGATVLVTHDPVDAVALADRVVVIEQGRVVQQGRVTEVLTDAWSPYVASLTGATFWVPDAVSVDPVTHRVRASLPGGVVVDSTLPRAGTGPSRVVFGTDAVTLSDAASPHPAEAVPARVLRVEQRLARLAVTVEVADGLTTTAEVPLSRAGSSDVTVGARVWVTLDADLVRCG